MLCQHAIVLKGRQHAADGHVKEMSHSVEVSSPVGLLVGGFEALQKPEPIGVFAQKMPGEEKGHGVFGGELLGEEILSGHSKMLVQPDMAQCGGQAPVFQALLGYRILGWLLARRVG